MEKQVVIARYNENLDWINQLNLPFVIYNKGEITNLPSIQLQNIGREAHSYLYHIVNNYNNLADITYFIQGDPLYHSPDLFERFFDYNEPTSLTYRYDELLPTKEFAKLDVEEIVNGKIVRYGDAIFFGSDTYKEIEEDLTSIWNRIFLTEKPEKWLYGYAAQWAVPKDFIQRRPIEDWEELLYAMEENAISAWIMELLWYYLFKEEYLLKLGNLELLGQDNENLLLKILSYTGIYNEVGQGGVIGGGISRIRKFSYLPTSGDILSGGSSINLKISTIDSNSGVICNGFSVLLEKREGLLFAEGFENYGISGRPLFHKYSFYRNALYNSLSEGRYFGYAWNMGANSSLEYDELVTKDLSDTSNNTLYLGFALQKRVTNGITSGSRMLVAFLDINNMIQAYLKFNDSDENIIECYKGNGTLVGSSVFIEDINWHYVEFGCFLDDTNGWLEVKLDNNQIIRFDNDTITDSDHITRVKFIAPFNDNNWSITLDDIYVTNTEFLGEIGVEAIIPTSNGSETEWTGGYESIDETPPNESDNIFADRNDSAIRSSFNFSNLVNLNEIKGISSEYIAKTSNSQSALKTLIINGVLNIVDIPVTISGNNYSFYSKNLDINPLTDENWSIDDINNYEFGVENYSDSIIIIESIFGEHFGDHFGDHFS